ncbi:MAG TPA: DUF58 domain-containing protein [Syntrophobacteraceae bacterium]|nr:DUF58 domain-containing protein [Syntrophobacteraceae bacterium]
MKYLTSTTRRFVHRVAGLDHAIKRWRTRRFTPSGQLVLLGLVIAAALGMDTTRTMAYQGFTFLLALLIVAVPCALFHRGRFTVRRVLPRMGTAGEPLVYRVVVRNDSAKVQGDLYLLEDPPKQRTSSTISASHPESTARGRHRTQSDSAPFRARDVAYEKGQTREKFHPLPVVPPGSEVEVRIELLPPRRGYLDFDRMTVARPDPFNLVRSLIHLPCRDSILILPRRYAIPDVALPGNRKYHRGGVALSTSVGESHEFIGLRDYRPGDPLRHIHWKSLAKVDKLIVKEYEEEFFIRHALILDTFLETGDTTLFEEAVSVAASFACTVSTQESLLDLMFVGAETYCLTIGRGLARTEKMLEVLACVDACRDKSFEVLKQSVLRRASLLSGCICILLGWDEQRRELVRALDALGMPRLVLVIGSAAATPETQAPATAAHDGPFFHRLEVGKIAQGLSLL